ncbi:hypothetical protein CEUSTIGMA_g6246.t1 [Chlamydomonas eustigma]|uniref:Uncharacterized protein n=1 Tax=Chlamydomonas eustigma TaxID=1157962 RepID=A0A250X7B5_9CHLO|nr:hypothetical protein CEUSTIGMA_g6246.t1 [Chlamydomonas eustigma]|eukprot:GAX78809.1 hypothetical protein CEUSTIGMA_g6246.t1 [Chlamydomonas eustigma]
MLPSPTQVSQQGPVPNDLNNAHVRRPGTQSWLGPNLIFTVLLPYWVATAFQDTYLKLGLVIALGIAGGHIILGAQLLLLRFRRVYPYFLEITMLILYSILLGIAFGSESGAASIQQNYNFIVNSTLAGVTLVTMMTMYPLVFQHVQEQVPWEHAGHEDVLTAGYFGTGALALSFVISCLLYLVPVSKGVTGDHMNAYNLTFRIFVPEVLTFIAALFVRFWPPTVVSHLQGTQAPHWTSLTILSTYPPEAKNMVEHPRVIDNAMLQPYPTVMVPGPRGVGMPAGSTLGRVVQNEHGGPHTAHMAEYYHLKEAEALSKGQLYMPNPDILPFYRNPGQAADLTVPQFGLFQEVDMAQGRLTEQQYHRGQQQPRLNSELAPQHEDSSSQQQLHRKQQLSSLPMLSNTFISYGLQAEIAGPPFKPNAYGFQEKVGDPLVVVRQRGSHTGAQHPPVPLPELNHSLQSELALKARSNQLYEPDRYKTPSLGQQKMNFLRQEQQPSSFGLQSEVQQHPLGEGGLTGANRGWGGFGSQFARPSVLNHPSTSNSFK